MFLLFAAAVATVACTASPDPHALLDANRAATVLASPPHGTRVARYAYHGQGLDGTVGATIDLGNGDFIQTQTLGAIKLANGFDGTHAWMRDLSGAYSPQAGGNKGALAINEAYRNANLWWRTDRGGARLESLDCHGLRITPVGGQPFEAWFDPQTHLLIRVREAQSYGATTDTHYSHFQRRAGGLIPTQIDIDTNDDPTDRQTLRLTELSTTAARPASTYVMPIDRPADWSLPSPGRVTMPFTLTNNHIIIDVRIDGRGPYPFLVDTGGHDIVTPYAAKGLGIRSVGDTPSSGAGEKSVSSGYAHIARIDAGGALLNNQTVITLDFSPPDVEGIQLGGMLGVEFLERFVVQIDYGAKTLTLVDPAKFSTADRTASGVAIPFVLYEHMPQVTGTFDGRPARYDIDTGSRVEVTLTAPFVSRERLSEAYPNGTKITDGWGVGGASRSYVVRAGELSLGSVTTSRPIASLSEAKHGSFSDANYDGNVGSGLLKRYVATFDYAGRTLYLKPARSLDPDVGAFDRVGMWINLGEGGMAVMDLAADGPAAQAGLRVGDVITAIDGAMVSTRSLSDVRRSLKTAPIDRTLAIAYSRAGASAVAQVIPRDLIPR
jgi:PDZ domain/Aspartyl protease